MIFMNSITEPGQPWVMISGSAFACFERTCRKWMSRPSMVVLYWLQLFSIASQRLPVVAVTPSDQPGPSLWRAGRPGSSRRLSPRRASGSGRCGG